MMRLARYGWISNPKREVAQGDVPIHPQYDRGIIRSAPTFKHPYVCHKPLVNIENALHTVEQALFG